MDAATRMASEGTLAKRVLVLGASGTIGRATVPALLAQGHNVVCLLRAGTLSRLANLPEFAGAQLVAGEVGEPANLQRNVFSSERFDAIVSCLASRSGAPADAWAIDHRAHMNVLELAKANGVAQFVQLSAICVQRPLLQFQHAKLAFEAALMASGLTWSIVRATAYFKSLSGQARRVEAGQPFLVFGDGQLTACKPISDRNLGEYLALCLNEPKMANAILPIGGPGDAITPLEQGEMLFEAFGKKPRFRHVPVAMLDAIIGGLSLAGRISKQAVQKAELARIGRYYATQSMLVLDPQTGSYSAQATPSFGADTLQQHYAKLARGEAVAQLGEHSVF